MYHPAKGCMFSVALIGPDGSGKTTIGRQLEQSFPVPVKYIYMGKNRDSSNVVLPTTRLVHKIFRGLGMKQENGPSLPEAGPPPRRSIIKRITSWLMLLFSRLLLISEGCYRQWVARRYQRRGCIVVCDRNFFIDFCSYNRDVPGHNPPLIDRLHEFLLTRVHSKPDLVIYLDAPAQLLFDRKGEGSLEALEYWRQTYLSMQHVFSNFAIIDAAQSADKVLHDVSAQLVSFMRTANRSEWKDCIDRAEEGRAFSPGSTFSRATDVPDTC